MTDKDYLQIARGRMATSLNWNNQDEIHNRASMQAQTAALIAIAERLGDLAVTATLIAEEFGKCNEREEMILAKTQNFVISS